MDVLNISAANSFEHEMMKAAVCYQLLKEGRHFLTEAKFTNNGKSGRADVVDLSTGRILEIVNSEKEESIEEKRSYYPLAVYVLTCNERTLDSLIRIQPR